MRARLDFFSTPVAFMSLLPECHKKHSFRCDMGYFYHISGIVVLFSTHLGDYHRKRVYPMHRITIFRPFLTIPVRIVTISNCIMTIQNILIVPRRTIRGFLISLYMFANICKMIIVTAVEHCKSVYTSKLGGRYRLPNELASRLPTFTLSQEVY